MPPGTQTVTLPRSQRPVPPQAGGSSAGGEVV